MDKHKNNLTTNTDVHIEQVNKSESNDDLDKTTIFEFLFDKDTKETSNKKDSEELSKTQQLFALNTKRKKVIDDFDLPKMINEQLQNNDLDGLELPKKSPSLSDTIKIKLSDLRAAVDQQEKEL